MYKARIAFVFIAFYSFWLLLSGNLAPANLILGFLVCSFTLYFFRGFLLQEPEDRSSVFSYIRRTIIFFLFLPVFFYQAYKSSLIVLKLVFQKDLDLHQGIVKIRTDVESLSGRTMLANLITLTPGTISVDINENTGELYIHCINIDLDEDINHKKEIIGAFEPWVLRIFDD